MNAAVTTSEGRTSSASAVTAPNAAYARTVRRCSGRKHTRVAATPPATVSSASSVSVFSGEDSDSGPTPTPPRAAAAPPSAASLPAASVASPSESPAPSPRSVSIAKLGRGFPMSHPNAPIVRSSTVFVFPPPEPLTLPPAASAPPPPLDGARYSCVSTH